MAKTIATIGGIALAPGVSRNRRWYTREHIAAAVAKAQERIKAGDEPMVMLSSHGADDQSREIAASLRSVSLDEDGNARYTAAIADTPAGRDIASLVDTSDGEAPHLKGVSIRGYWEGTVRKVRGPDGELAEQGQGLVLDGLDFTRKPGVTAAQVDTFAWTGATGATETTERVLITESVQEARVTITEETAPAPPQVPGGIGEAFRAILGAAPVEESPPLSKRDSGLAGAGRVWADPGYQADKKQRYDLSTKANAKAAYSYLSQKDNASKYTPAQLKRVMGRIKGALKRFGVTVAAEGWTVEPAFQVTEAVAEYFGSPEACGSYSLTATNGPTTVTVCSYGLEPADLQVILQRACSGAGMALCALDPDMDGDIDVPGADSEDTDHDAGETRTLSLDQARETYGLPPGSVPLTETSPPDPASGPAAAAPTSKEGSAVSETTTQEAAPAPVAAPSITLTEAQFGELLARTAPAAPAVPAATETAPAPAAPAAPAVTETSDERIARLVEERAAARIAAEVPAAVAETEEQRIERLVEARVTAEKQRLTASGAVAPARKGLTSEGAVDEHTATVSTAGADTPPAPPGKSWDEMHKWSTEELNQYATPGLADYVFKGRAGRAV